MERFVRLSPRRSCELELIFIMYYSCIIKLFFAKKSIVLLQLCNARCFHFKPLTERYIIFFKIILDVLNVKQ